MEKLRLLGMVCAWQLSLISGQAAHAATIIQYHYTGLDFDSNYLDSMKLCTSGDPGCFNNITATFQLSAELGMDYVLGTITPDAWSISDGRTTITDQTSGFYLFALQAGTDGNGDIDQWNFTVARNNTQPLNELESMRTTFGAGINAADDTRYCTVFTGGSCSHVAVASNGDPMPPKPGSWTMTTPLPPAAWLFASGLLGMLGFARRRRSA